MADETRIDTLAWRTKPGSTPSHGGRNPDRHPRMADETRIDDVGWRTKPGWQTKPGSTPSDGGRNPDRHPRMADETRIDRLGTPALILSPRCRCWKEHCGTSSAIPAVVFRS